MKRELRVLPTTGFLGLLREVRAARAACAVTTPTGGCACSVPVLLLNPKPKA